MIVTRVGPGHPQARRLTLATERKETHVSKQDNIAAQEALVENVNGGDINAAVQSFA